MLFYVLFVLVAGVIVRIYQIYQQAQIQNITYPSATSYLSLVKDLTLLKADPSAKAQLQNRFMTFVADLGARSLDEQGSGVGYFRLPNLTSVFVLSNKSLIQQLYAKQNESKFGQQQFFKRLEVILGPDNLMSSVLGSETHSTIRPAILSRNEKNRPQVTGMVADFFKEYESKQGENGMPLADVMDMLSRRVLLTTYFGQKIIKPFEAYYNPSLTKELIDCLFGLEPIKMEEGKNLLLIRSKIFNLGCQILFSAEEVTKLLTQEQSWLNFLLVTRVLKNPYLESELQQLGITSMEHLPADQCEILIKHAIENGDTTRLSALIRDVINESLFIPLLGFDATATALIATLKIALQDKRIYTLMKQEIQHKNSTGEPFELNSPWDSRADKGGLSYIEAILLEALRLSPPAPIVPEIIHEAIHLDLDGTVLTLPKGALVFIPMQGVHTHAKHVPDIVLSREGQEVLGKKVISAHDIFPERWGPLKSNLEPYNAHFFSAPPTFYSPGKMEKEGGLLTFKTGARRCPGLRIAITEIMALFRMLAIYKFELSEEDHLELRFHYEKPLQRNGGLGLLKIKPRKMPITSTNVQENSRQSGLSFFPGVSNLVKEEEDPLAQSHKELRNKL